MRQQPKPKERRPMVHSEFAEGTCYARPDLPTLKAAIDRIARDYSHS